MTHGVQKKIFIWASLGRFLFRCAHRNSWNLVVISFLFFFQGTAFKQQSLTSSALWTREPFPVTNAGTERSGAHSCRSFFKSHLVRVQQRHLWSGWLWCFLVLSLQEILSRKTSSTCTKSPTERGSFYSTCSTISPVNTKQTLACLLVCLFFGGVWFLKHVNDWFWCNQDDFKWENVLTTVVMSHEEIVPILDERQRLAIPSKRIWTSVMTLFSRTKAPFKNQTL